MKLVTAPSGYPVSLAEAKAHLRYEDDDQDALISALIGAAVDYAQNFLGRSLLDQAWDYYLDSFDAAKPLTIPLPPLIEVVGLFYLDSAGDEQEFSAASYSVDNSSEPARISLLYGGTWPTAIAQANAIRVRFRAGYLNTDSPPVAAVPFAIKAAILLTVGTLFEHRETVVIGQTAVTLPFGAEQLLRQYRVQLGMA